MDRDRRDRRDHPGGIGPSRWFWRPGRGCEPIHVTTAMEDETMKSGSMEEGAFAGCSAEDVYWANEALKVMEPIHHRMLADYASARGGLSDEEMCRTLRVMGALIRKGWRAVEEPQGRLAWVHPDEASAVAARKTPAEEWARC